MSDGQVELDPGRVAALLDMGRYDEARDLARQALARDPGDAVFLELLVVASIQLRDHRTALEDASRLVALAPNHAKAHELLGVALHNRKRLRDSVTEIQRAVALDPNNAWYHVRLSEFLLDYAKRGVVTRRGPIVRRAAQEAHEACRLAPGAPEPYLALANAGLALRDEQGAAEALQRALEIDPQNHLAHQMMGKAALKSGKFSRAGDHFMDAGRLAPHDPSNATLLRIASGRWVWKIALIAVVYASLMQLQSGTNRDQLLGAASAALAIMVIAAIVSFVITRRLSPEARAALERDRQLRRRRR